MKGPWLVAAGLGLALAVMVASKRLSAGEDQVQALGNRIAVVHLTGGIFDPEDTVLWLHRLQNQVDGIAAVVLAIDSPGGGVAASQEIYFAVQRLRAAGIRVVASMGSVAASGAYYVASAADSIVAKPGSLTGSIGVIVEYPDASNLLETVGLRFEVVKSGKFKDTGNMGRAMTASERELLQKLIDDVHGQFVEAIIEERRGPLKTLLARKRNLPDESSLDDDALRQYLSTIADGRIFSGRQALELGLVDQLGDTQDAIDTAARLAGLDDPEVVTRKARRHWADLLAASLAGGIGQAAAGIGRQVVSSKERVPSIRYSASQLGNP